ncbi:hypothetical protein MCOR27_001735 [Pyricularia oryzae]|nr:hypothetical protein MCOR27_001735 [Pyricularia oryzae]KAI6297667.1 hypothetical protein MCOR34_009341 [Pyricularia oryzae]KAI6362514.1 hypothetical protein MCOR32_008462 [Pyricularia oryzae]KAI6450278.1 hypothetical protein MCOR22_001924 [Pyricularia oryzae]KAI6458970.1 hypothetical protein MCOR17_007161 [Pyricularia oryzae]
MAASQVDQRIQEKHPGIAVHGTKGVRSGRSLRATRDFQPGDLIAEFDNPLAAFPDAARASTTCHHCLDQNAKVFGCMGCEKAVKYCSSECQRANWKLVHSKECKVFRKVQTAVGKDWLPTPVRTLVQLLVRWAEVQQLVSQLEGNEDRFKERKQLWEDMKLQAYAGIHYAGRKEDDANLFLSLDVLCKIQTNSFDRFDADTGASGTFLDPVLAMANHSCVPNAVVLFWRRKAYLRAEMPIKQGSEISISYIDYTKPVRFREEDLWLYHFTCKCPRCKDDLNVYEVCRDSSVVPLNDLTLSPGVEKLLYPPGEADRFKQKSWRSKVEAIYEDCQHDRSAKPTFEERFAMLRANWQSCKPLVDAQLWAWQPLAQTLQGATLYYLGMENHTRALSTACFTALHCDPYQYVAPFKTFRLTGLMLIAKILTQTSVPDREELAKTAHPEILAILDRSDQASMLHAILLIVVNNAPKGHSDDWEVLHEAKTMLSGIESIEGREDESMLLRRWVKNPENHADKAFFQERVLRPIESLAKVAPEILRADLS